MQNSHCKHICSRYVLLLLLLRAAFFRSHGRKPQSLGKSQSNLLQFAATKIQDKRQRVESIRKVFQCLHKQAIVAQKHSGAPRATSSAYMNIYANEALMQTMQPRCRSGWPKFFMQKVVRGTSNLWNRAPCSKGTSMMHLALTSWHRSSRS